MTATLKLQNALRARFEETFPQWKEDVLRLRESGMTPSALKAECQRLKLLDPTTGVVAREENRKNVARRMNEGASAIGGTIAFATKAVVFMNKLKKSFKGALGQDDEAKILTNGLKASFDELSEAKTPEQREMAVAAVIRRGEDLRDFRLKGIAAVDAMGANLEKDPKLATTLRNLTAFAFISGMRDAGVDLTAYGADAPEDLLEALRKGTPVRPNVADDTPSPL